MSRWMRWLPNRANVNAGRQWIANLTTNLAAKPWARKSMTAFGALLIGGVAFVFGRTIGLQKADAIDPPVPGAKGSLYTPEMQQRVVAYIYQNIPITREELAEHLIARYGGERLEFLVNRKIVEKACAERGITVTDLEVEQQFQHDLRAIGNNVTPKVFQDQVLKRYNKTIFEWKEDVIRPKLSMAKLVRPEISVTEDDVRKGFEGRYGAKVQCRLIIYQKHDIALKAWEKIKGSPNVADAFMAEAKVQYIPQMQATGGEIPPIHLHFGDARIEREVFSLKPGEITPIIGMPDGTALIFLCVNLIPPTKDKSYAQERDILYKEIFDIKLAERIPKKVQELRIAAAPRFLIERRPMTEFNPQEIEAEISPLNYRAIEGKK